MLTFHIDSDFYGNARRLIRGSEGFKSYIYPDTAKIPTIGYGYAMLIKNKKTGKYEVNGNLQADFSAIGLTLTAANLTLLGSIAKNLSDGDKTAAATKIATLDAQIRDISATEAQTLFNFTFDRAMSTVASALKSRLGPTNGALLAAEMTGSTEMIALVDMAFNGGFDLIGPGLSKALWNDDRAEAWYQIRHDSNAEGWREIKGNLPMNSQGGAGLAKRRYIEAQMFGLYEASTAAPDEREAEFLGSKGSASSFFLRIDHAPSSAH